MQILLRLFITFVTTVSAFYFTFWMGGALLYGLNLSPRWSLVIALVGAAAVGRYVWVRTASVPTGLASAVLTGAFVVGGIGFAGGFFGPIVFSPGANQGPLLGIFITGPLGFIAGAIGGAVYWAVRSRAKRVAASPSR
jgi:hypothetical protein